MVLSLTSREELVLCLHYDLRIEFRSTFYCPASSTLKCLTIHVPPLTRTRFLSDGRADGQLRGICTREVLGSHQQNAVRAHLQYNFVKSCSGMRRMC